MIFPETLFFPETIGNILEECDQYREKLYAKRSQKKHFNVPKIRLHPRKKINQNKLWEYLSHGFRFNQPRLEKLNRLDTRAQPVDMDTHLEADPLDYILWAF